MVGLESEIILRVLEAEVGGLETGVVVAAVVVVVVVVVGLLELFTVAGEDGFELEAVISGGCGRGE